MDTFTLSLASLTQAEYVYEILQHAVNVKQEVTHRLVSAFLQ